MRRPDDEKNGARKSPSLDDEITSPVSSPVPTKAAVEPGRADTPPRALEQRYELLGEAGRGGMGIVYRARDRETGEQVALKVLKPEIAADAGIVERFKNELRLARKITHKNVCRIHEFNRAADGTAYISMEFVEGESLRRVLSRFGNLGVRGGTRIARQICAGLREAHVQGVVHRDLKPENVMVDREGNVKVMDFGIARSLETGTTGTTGIMGTPAYMAPEQAEGKAVDPRADIYALGLMLYELFTGSTAFKGDTPMAVALKQIHETPPAPREVEPALPAHIEKAILKCLEKNPAKRFQSVDELEAALTKEAEVKPVAEAGEGVEVALPISLATWQRADWFLLASGVLGTAVFFLLFYRFHPASAWVVEMNAEQQRQITADALKKLQWNVEVGRPVLHFVPESYYYELASTAGSWAAQYRLLHLEGVVGDWSGGLKKSEAEGKVLEGDYQTNLHGRLRGLFFSTRGTGVHVQQGPAPDEASTARMKEIAQTAAVALFGEDLSATKALVRAFPPSPGQCWRVGFSWALPQQPQGLVTKVNVQVEGSRLVSLSHWLDYESPAEQEFDWEAYSPPVRYLAAGLMMVWFALILFFARRIYREPRSVQNLRLAVLIGLGGAVATSPALPEFGGPGEAGTLSGVVWGGLTFSIFTLLSYVVLNAVLYYLRRCFPVQGANYLQLFRDHVFARTAGLEMLRGVSAGAAFSGTWMALLSLGGVWGKALAGMPFWLQAYSGFAIGFVHVISPFQARVFPVLLIGEVLLIGWLLVALPLSLLSRATARWRFLLAALSVLWLAFGFSLAGAMVFPTWPYLIFVVLQAVFCGVVFLRYGLLATLSAVFTIEVGLLAFPLLEIFQNIDPLPYAIPVVLWFLLLLAATGIYLRPQVVGAYRRLAAVFE